MKTLTKRLVLVVLLLAMAYVPAYGEPGKETLSQISTLDALAQGYFDGVIPVSKVSKYGNFGIGTFQGLDGEMLVLDGKVYQVPVSGAVRVADPKWTIPFMAVTYFKAGQARKVPAGTDMKTLAQETEAAFPSKNLFYAIRIEGTFEKVKTRSVAKQPSPYPTLAEALKKQAVFELSNVEGTAIGFWCPTYVKGINLPGYHLHFLTKNGKAGGHVLDFTTKNTVVKVQKLNEFSMILPDTPAFGRLDFTTDRSAEVKKVE